MSSQTPVWFVTAASSGFGKYMALEALSRGHKVIASARSTSRIADLKEKGAVTVTLDVTAPPAEIENVAKEANEQYGYINHLVNAAGYILVGAVEETSYVIFGNVTYNSRVLDQQDADPRRTSTSSTPTSLACSMSRRPSYLTFVLPPATAQSPTSAVLAPGAAAQALASTLAPSGLAVASPRLCVRNLSRWASM